MDDERIEAAACAPETYGQLDARRSELMGQRDALDGEIASLNRKCQEIVKREASERLAREGLIATISEKGKKRRGRPPKNEA